MPRISLPEGASVHCIVDDFLWPWDRSTPVLMMHGFARNATFWNRWVPAIAETRRIYRPELIGCGESDVPAAGYEFTPEAIADQLMHIGRSPYLAHVRVSSVEGREYLGKLLVLIRTAFRNDMTYYKPATLERRIERRMALQKIDRMDDYVTQLRRTKDRRKR